MERNALVDLHMHSTASDGTWRSERLVENVLKAGIKLFALTDHDSTENVPAVALLAAQNGLSFVPSVEVSTLYENRTYHILGLGIKPGHEALEPMLAKNRRLMDDKDDAGIQYLASIYPERVSFEEYLAYVDDKERGGWKSLNYLVDKGLCTSHKDFFSLFIDWKEAFSQVEFPAPQQAIAAIKAAGGIPILAHPGSRSYDPDTQKILKDFNDMGVMGFECFHPDNNEEATRLCLSFCWEHGLRITGGSDCHGDFVPSRGLGHPLVRLSDLDLEGITILPPGEI